MIAHPEGLPAHTGMCWFGMQQIPPRLEAFEKEIDGVRKAEDIEYIHRMRVASRRLRAALPLFLECFPPKQYKRWMAEIANITRALGEARDADVQIAFLQKQIKKRTADWKKQHAGSPASRPPEEAALRYLLAELKKKRAGLQNRVISALDSLEKSRIIPEMKSVLSTLLAGYAHAPARALMYGIAPVAAVQIAARLDTMLSYEHWVHHPEAVAEHHATRIAAKKLRYTIELFNPVYRLGLGKALARTKKIQEILGDIHDCDVWIDAITVILLKERSRFRTENEEKRPGTATIASLKALLREREKTRQSLYRTFVRTWNAQKRAGTWENLKHDLVSARKKRFRPHGDPMDQDIRAAVSTLASVYPEGLPHARTVTRLALMLFDTTKPVHGMGERERFLLEQAAMLHDIGWMKGSRRHNKKSADIILAAETLPFDFRERALIGLAALAHRGRTPLDHEPLFTLLSPEYRQVALALAALLRVSDGLDFPQAGNVQEVHCVIGSDKIILDAVSPIDITQEKEHARSKSDLFGRVFSRELVVR